MLEIVNHTARPCSAPLATTHSRLHPLLPVCRSTSSAKSDLMSRWYLPTPQARLCTTMSAPECAGRHSRQVQVRVRAVQGTGRMQKQQERINSSCRCATYTCMNVTGGAPGEKTPLRHHCRGHRPRPRDRKSRPGTNIIWSSMLSPEGCLM